jgi:ABC-type nitrate/sulfonate/bicarbonate transport system ATPase subunit
MEVRNVSKTFTGDTGHVYALRNVSMHFDAGEFVAIIGPSGCGKSTLLRMLAGLDQPSAGAVLFHGQFIPEPNPRISMVFQNFALLPWKTVKENVLLALRTQEMPEQHKEHIANQLLTRVGLRNFERHYPGELSGGMKQRVGIARALSVNPEVLLLDEPFSALDEITALDLRRQLLDLWQEKRVNDTYVLVTHLVEEAVLLADTVYIMSPRPGQVIAKLKIDLPRPRFEHHRSKKFFQEVDRIQSILQKHSNITV